MNVCFFLLAFAGACYGLWYDDDGLGPDPGPAVRATQGQVWPKPQNQVYYGGFMTVNPTTFLFTSIGETCDILEKGLERYKTTLERIRRKSRKVWKMNQRKRRILQKEPGFQGQLDALKVNLAAPCESLPYLQMDEHYELRVNSDDMKGDAQLYSQSIWGILRGLESFVQILYALDTNPVLLVNSTSIQDFPRFSHRGLHLDTARHFMPMRVILNVLDGMAMNKFNVFHWHIVDDQSFPFQSKVWPLLSEKGAYTENHVYTPKNVAEVIETARLRGIRVVPEFDTPGHTRSWGLGYPDLLVDCYGDDGLPNGVSGPMHPFKNYTFNFVSDLLKELSEVFKDKFFHLGGDEVPFSCWLSNPELSQYMFDNNMTPQQLEGIFVARLVNQSISINQSPIVWQEIYENGITIPKSTVIHVWKDWTDYMGLMSNITRSGFPALFSSCWYLDHLTSGGDWRKFYDCDPTNFPGTSADKKLVIGGEACMWAEVADGTNVQTRIWPRASAVAEKLWSAESVVDAEDASRRLEELACKMNLRGIPAQPPNGAGFCRFTNIE